MATSSNFDSEHEFTGDDAARLIVGDQHSGSKQHETALVLKKLKTAYQLALKYYDVIFASDNEDRWTSPDRPSFNSQAIRCSTMEASERLLASGLDPKAGTLVGWLTHGRTVFNAQTFGRNELQRWIDVMEISAAYRFDGVEPASTLSDVEPAENKIAEAGATPTSEETTNAIKREGLPLKRVALIQKHAKEWKTIEADLQHASENGLSKAAKAPPHGYWFEERALAWARQRGGIAAQSQSAPTNSVFDLPGTKHGPKG